MLTGNGEFPTSGLTSVWSSIGKIYVPIGCGEAYRKAWPMHADIIEEMDF